MKWRSARRSSNVVGAGRGGMKFGLGGIVLAVVIGLLLGKNPVEMLGLLGQMQQQPLGNEPAPPPDNETTDFVRAILGETEDVWASLFAQRNARYEAPRLVLFSGAVQTACGGASSASGPFYCPGDRQVYLDVSFFDEMRARLGGGGDFAYAYVIAHEVGHHVQTLSGSIDQVHQARGAGREVHGDGGLLVRQELQADCYAGVWAHHAQSRHQWLEEGDVEAALNTASAIGDDRLQQQSQGTVVPDAFTHGSAEQRVRWFRIGFSSGEIARCDTFAARDL